MTGLCIYADASSICTRQATVFAYCEEHAPNDPRFVDAYANAMQAVEDGDARRIERYVSAFQSLAALVAPPERCAHGVRIADDCLACEPLLDHDAGFDEAFADDRRHGFAL